MTRNVTCLRGGTIPVELHLCQSAATYAVDLKTQERCYAPCRGDCRVSEWSHWSHCHRNCQAADVGRCMVPFMLHAPQHRYVTQAVLLYVDVLHFDFIVLHLYLAISLWQTTDMSNMKLHFFDWNFPSVPQWLVQWNFCSSNTTCSWWDCHFYYVHVHDRIYHLR